TLDNALKMLMVKSANDIAVTIAEGVSGSVEAFADDMNSAARSLGLTQSHFINPNGLPDPNHVSSARDLAVLARALYITFPEQADLFNIGALQLGGKIIRNHNDLLGRYPGADGMKTGFICASGFNVVASATQGGRKVIAVILGAPNPRSRAMMAATLFDRAFAGVDRPSKSLAELAPGPLALPDIQQASCRNRGRTAAAYIAQVERLLAPLLAARSAPSGNFVLMTTQSLGQTAPVATRIAMVPAPAFQPVPVYIGPPADYAGHIAQARPPHSPIGTPPPPGTVSAYAAEAPEMSLAGTPLSQDASALPMRGRVKQAAARAKGRVSYKSRPARAERAAGRKTANISPRKASQKAQGTTAGKKPRTAETGVLATPKIAAVQTIKTPPSPRPATLSGKTTGKKPDTPARQ
ncbi:MAG: D-alanyl-D-alanine carboxypeptidase, partial [Beijerinckiaceae bacterium]|nr:D-alanyl-D-alanine carboxypeptidase [Beijerinckiaceae bacterium]